MLTSYETGLKADWLDDRLLLDVAAFYLDWEDMQLFAEVNDVRISANSSTAVSKGLEFAATATPMCNLIDEWGITSLPGFAPTMSAASAAQVDIIRPRVVDVTVGGAFQ